MALKKIEKKKKIDPQAIRKSYLDKIEDSMTSEGVVLFEPDKNLHIDSDCLVLPKHITDVASRELGEYLNAFTQQKMYLRTVYGRQELMVEESKRKYLSASQGIYESLSRSKMSETAKDRLITQDDSVVEEYNDYQDQKRKLSILDYAIANIEDAVFLISREVTRRTGDFNDENRNYNVGRK